MSSANYTESLSIEEIKEKFENETYSLRRVPRILEIETGGIFINRKAPYPNELESLEDMDWERDKVQTHKLKKRSYGDLQFKIGMINTKYFESREKLDCLFESKTQETLSSNFERISIENALKHFSIDLSCNMEYYMENKHELEIDLKRKDVNIDVNNELEMKKIEKELFYNQMCRIFGGNNEETSDDYIQEPDVDGEVYSKALILKDFHMFYKDETIEWQLLDEETITYCSVSFINWSFSISSFFNLMHLFTDFQFF